MAANESIFEQLQKTQDEQAAKIQVAEAEDLARQQRAQAHLANLISQNSTLPCTISSVHVLGAPNTRPGFLRRIFDPILSSNQDRPYTLSEALQKLSAKVDKLNRLDIYQQPIPLSIAQSGAGLPSDSLTDLDVYLNVKERSRVTLKTGTDVGNAEGSAYVNGSFRNLFGGAESLHINAALGTRTRSSYSASFDTPILSNPDLRWELGGLASATQKPWASHEEALKGVWTKFRWMTNGGSRHELGYNGVWRQVTGLSATASPTVRADAGDSVKSSISHSWTLDRRDNPILPTKGFLSKSLIELAGWGPLQGDVSFAKAELESQGAMSIYKNITMTSGLRTGVLCPLNNRQPSRINDRFQLGGPTDVRGFRLSGLGPHDGTDAVGGDVYAAGGASLLFPIPRVDAARPFRLQAFINGGKLLALQQQTPSAVAQAYTELAQDLPSISAGFGLVYAAPVARVEVNFSLPLVLRKGEEGRKGISFGIGINML